MKDTLKFKCHPKYWPLWLAFGIFRLLVLLPYGFQLFLGKWLGRALGFFGGKGKRTAMTNIALCFPEMSEQDRLRLLKRNFESMGMFAFEVAIACTILPAIPCEEKAPRITNETSGTNKPMR